MTVKRNLSYLLCSFLVTLLAYNVHAQESDMELAIDWYKKRYEGAVDLRAKNEPINRAIGLFEDVLKEDPKNEEAAVFLLKSIFHKGTFVCDNDKDRTNTYRKGKDLGEGFLVQFPNSSQIRFWYAVNLGKWAENKGIMAAAREGVIGKMKEQCEFIISTDKTYEGCGAMRALGECHLQAPYIPFVLTWPDKEEALKILEESVENSPEFPGNNVSYAKVLRKMGYKEKAFQILKRTITFQPRPDYLLEDKKEIKEAEELLKKYFDK